jgi:transcriptional regulator with XRE-family HTH domain
MRRVEIGKRIKKERIRHGLTQSELAEKLEVSQGAIGSWEIGFTVPKAQNLLKLSEILEIPIDELLKAG